MEIYRLTVVNDANGSITEKSIYKDAVASSPSSKGSPLFSSWLPLIHNSLTSLLRWTGTYPAEVQESHLAFVRDVVVPRLKPPAAADRLYYIGTHSHGIYEASLAFATHKPARVRFTVQPLVDPSPAQGGDLLGQKALRNTLEGMASACGADRAWLDAFLDSVFLTAEEELTLVGKRGMDAANGDAGAAGGPLRQNGFVAFDLEADMDENEKAVTVMKTYLFPQLKAIATGQKTVNTTDSIVKRLAGGDKDMLAAWELVKTFLITDGGEKINLDFLAIDCLAPCKEPRFKVYVSTRFKSLAAVREAFTLGGLLPSSSADFLSQVWPQLLDMEDIPQAEMEDLEKPLNNPDSHHQGVGFAFSVVPGQAVPQIKMYVPMWQFARDEARIVECYRRVLQTQGTMGDYDINAAIQGAL
ncbi:aromatic prenyltransferase [Colletotrichum graminicola]|uniref:Aromatic prenyltransferase n=1 Tax=Colletotrichum graminicola (strain M1.001 / M2 / FGSC 10212) TaxID=645133 RepID=E3QZJ0_COLGM|nr:aromatic prenyltransferase [Colletotrichum graminicola M1.001]EFQ36278.1 aromatic prenyltransferase [Colletotrichum graminicola M1.001]WDK23710.1 aromatic prenyltransferase [Colletotrichum graminicola]